MYGKDKQIFQSPERWKIDVQAAVVTISTIVMDKEQRVYVADGIIIPVQDADVEAIRAAMHAERLSGETQPQPQAEPKRVLKELHRDNIKRAKPLHQYPSYLAPPT